MERAQVPTTEPEDVEHVENGIAAAPQQIIELRPPSRVEAHDFAIQDGFTIQVQMDSRAQFEKALVRVALVRNKPCFVLTDVRERSKTVHLQLEHKIVVVKSFRQPLQVCRRKLCEGQ